MEITNEAMASLTIGTTVTALVLRECRRRYTLLHTGIDSSGADDVNAVMIAVAPEVPSMTPALNRCNLLAGMAIEVGGDNGPLSLALKVAAGAPVITILAGDLDQ